MKILNLLTGAVVVAAVTGCASSPQLMSADSRVPAAQGEVKAKDEDNGNTHLKVKVKHMAKPSAVEPMASTYVVWAQDNTNTGNVQNLGALQVDDDLEGEIEAITPMKRFDVFITAEPVATAQYPTGTKTLWTTVESN
jgi:hypothetical protein